MPGVGDPGSRPAAGCASEQLGELAFRQRVAGLYTQPVRGYRRVIDGAGLNCRILTVPGGGDCRPPGDPIRGLARLAGHPAPTCPPLRHVDEPGHVPADLPVGLGVPDRQAQVVPAMVPVSFQIKPIYALTWWAQLGFEPVTPRL